ncbi:hypothetical protein QBC46DRAFT_372602 [Diplogelasinospora grovesii]|uniref:Uncharacterized protein n=1 Tax=Diplogelasinospora grovesii TaxID=303347 RepID=A0AAN6NHU7_9PEZI|nr:hypothetical protein QBC46DRAFT_372602 [Diplogelasinospora grovesii]
MGATASVIKTLVIPALISLILFLVSTYVLIPLWLRYRNRYSQYLPLETISNQTSSLRTRLQNGIGSLLVPSTWRRRLQDRLVVADRTSSDGDYDSEEGEELGDVDEPTTDRRRVLDLGRHPVVDDTRRLSRDLEEGFRDDSDEELEVVAR